MIAVNKPDFSLAQIGCELLLERPSGLDVAQQNDGRRRMLPDGLNDVLEMAMVITAKENL